MDTALFIVCAAAYLFAAATASVSQMHMFQLNSYSPVKHLKWIRKNMESLTPHAFSALLCVIALLPASARADKLLLVLFSACFAVSAIAFIPKKKAKKPLVYTPRVIRMFVCELLLTSAALAFAAILGGLAGAAVLLGAFFLLPLIVILTNIINFPVEEAVRRHYVNDAKKILKKCPDLTVIGITGSYGKTSMKYFLTTLLRGKYDVLMTPESYNTPMGVVKTVRGELKGYHQIFVCEMGAKRVGEIKELCDIVSPTHGIVASIGPQHLETFKTVENVIKTKFELANAVTGKCLVNIDNEYIRENLPDGAVTYGTCPDADYYAEVQSVSRRGTAFSVRLPGGEVLELSCSLIGAHNVVNLCGAVAMAHFLGVSPEEIRAQLSKIQPVPHRLQLIEKGGGIAVIDDAFNSNPTGAKAALDTLALFEEFKILVTPGMIELGDREEELNREFGRRAAQVCDYVVLVGKKQTEPILAGLADMNFPKEKIFVADSFNECMQAAYSVGCDRGKIILLENDLPDNY